MTNSIKNAEADSKTEKPRIASEDKEEEVPIRTGFAGMLHFRRRDEIEERLTIDTDYATEPGTAVAALRERADQLEEEHGGKPDVDNRITTIRLMADKIEIASESASYSDDSVD